MELLQLFSIFIPSDYRLYNTVYRLIKFIFQNLEVENSFFQFYVCFVQELHVCIEGWRNFRWSEPFGIDGRDGETVVRVLHNKDETATLFIQVRKITAMQRQVCDQTITNIYLRPILTTPHTQMMYRSRDVF